MKVAVVRYRTQNIGDDIQSLALERILPRVDLLYQRNVSYRQFTGYRFA